MGKRVIITGATGMVGEGVLHRCLQNEQIDHILLVSRKSYGMSHPKISELLIPDFFQLEGLEEKVQGYDACFFCLGVSSVGMKEDKYRHLTYDLTLGFAKKVLAANTNMTFCYVSGDGTRSDEQGMMWARVKGKTENDLLQLGFADAYMFRPGMIEPMKGMKNTYRVLRVLGFLFPVFRVLSPKHYVKLSQLGDAMIAVTVKGYNKKVLDCMDIKEVAKQE
ncbi:MAG: epimerase [Chitinophagales bacterium]